jgi:DNA repair exonuclease SbcCD ATPase subunit
MSESRYGIIADLTEKKLKIIDEISNIDSAPELKKTEILNVEQCKVDELEELSIRANERAKYYDERIASLNSQIKIMEDNRDIKLESLHRKLEELNSAMVAINEISKTAGTEKQ